MTEANVQEEQDKALGQYMRLKANLAAARERLGNAGDVMSDLGGKLRSQPASKWIGFQFTDYPWLNRDGLKVLIEDVLKAQEETEKARSKAINLGVAIPKDS